MTNPSSERSQHEQQLDALIAEYYEAAERGRPPDRAEFLRQHPDFVNELREFFADVGQIEQVASPVRPALEDTKQYDSSRNSSLSPGELVRYIGDYEILEELGSGGMGVVYKARQAKLKKIVALKMIKVGQLASEQEVRRFQAEARAAANLDHPGIVTVHEVGVHRHQHYYAMDYVAGGSLSKLHRDEPVAARRAAELVKQMAEAMHYAHGQGIVHRDLKPANVLLTTAGVPRITDFGLAKRLWSDEESAGVTMTETGQVLGTAGYMSPEQAAGKSRLVGPSADIYALGAILYALLTSRAPFVGESQADTILQVIQKEPVPPRTLNPSTPRDLETICLKCLEKEPHKRYGTAQLLADDLGRFLEGRPVVARPISSPARAWRWSRRNPWIATALALVLVVATVSPVVATVLYQLADAKDRALGEKEKALGEKDKAIVEKDDALVTKGKALEEKEKAFAEKEAALEEAKKSLKTARWNTYVARFYNLTTAWKEQRYGDLDRMLAELEPLKDQPDFRGWEYYYLRDQYDSRVAILPDRTERYVYARFSPDGKLLALRREDKGIEVWDWDRRAKLNSLPGELNVQCAWNPEGNLLAVHQKDTVRIFDVRMSKQVTLLQGKKKSGYARKNYGLDWSRDGKRIALAGDGWVEVWKSDGAHERTIPFNAEDPEDFSKGLSWHPDNQRIALSTHDGFVQVLDADVDTEATLWSKEICNIGTTDAQWSPDGKTLAVGAHFPVYRTLFFDEQGKQLAATEPRLGGYFTTSWNSSGTRVVTRAEDEHITICDTSTGSTVQRIHLHSATVKHVAWRPGSSDIVSLGDDGGFRCWQADMSLKPAMEIPFPGDVRSLAWHPNQSLLAAAGAADILLFDSVTGKLERSLKGHGRKTSAVGWHPDGEQLASVDPSGEIRIWNLATGDSQPLYAGSAGIGFYHLEFSPNGRYLACGSSESRRPSDRRGVRVFDLSDNLQEVLFDPRYRGTLAWSPDSFLLATGDYDTGIVSLWNVAERKMLWSEKHWSIVHVAFRPDGRQVGTGHTNGTFQIRDVDGKLLITEQSHSHEVSRLIWSPNRARIATTSHDGGLRIWDAATCHELLTISAHTERSDALCWNADGTRIATGGRDKVIRIWGSAKIPKPTQATDSDETGVLSEATTGSGFIAN